VKEIWSSRAAQVAAKYGEHVPTATVCCNACRTCVQTNVVALGIAALSGAGGRIARFARRTVKPL